MAFTDESDVLRELSSDEHRAHNEGQGVPLAHAPRGDRSKTFGALNLAMLSGVNAHLTGNRGQHQDQGVDGGGPHCEVRGLALPKGLLTCCGHVAGCLANHEIRREECSEEHEFAGQPHPDTHR